MRTVKQNSTNLNEDHVCLDPGDFHAKAESSTTLPADWYYDSEIFTLEHEAVFYKTWWYQCHVSDLINPGDYVVGAVADQEIFIIRDHNNRLNCFYNVCSHRAHPLLSDQGNTELIVCPYHQWCYQTDGCFRGARGQETMSAWLDENADLKPVRLENYGGFLFVNLDPDAEPLSEQAPKFLQDMYQCCPKLDHLVRARRFERDIAANWKTVIDNNHECYHCQANHKSLMDLVDYDNKAIWSDDGITFTHCVERKNLNSSAYSVELKDLEQDSLFGYIWPNLIPLFFPGTPGLIMFQVIPTGPESSRVRHDYYLLNRDPSQQEQQFMDWFSHVLSVEDIDLCESVQKGLHSKGYHQGRFVVDRNHVEYSEHHVHFFQNLVANSLMSEI